MIGLLLSMNWEDNSYNIILIIIDCPIKIVYIKLIKTIIDITSLAKIIIDMMVRYHGLL